MEIENTSGIWNTWKHISKEFEKMEEHTRKIGDHEEFAILMKKKEGDEKILVFMDGDDFWSDEKVNVIKVSFSPEEEDAEILDGILLKFCLREENPLLERLRWGILSPVQIEVGVNYAGKVDILVQSWDYKITQYGTFSTWQEASEKCKELDNYRDLYYIIPTKII